MVHSVTGVWIAFPARARLSDNKKRRRWPKGLSSDAVDLGGWQVRVIMLLSVLGCRSGREQHGRLSL
jgi:hypothetical protein